MESNASPAPLDCTVSHHANKETNMPSWIKCSEKMPEEYEVVLCSMEVQGVSVVRALLLDLHDKDHGRLWIGIGACYPEISRVTHWMQLPEPPCAESVPVANTQCTARAYQNRQRRGYQNRQQRKP